MSWASWVNATMNNNNNQPQQQHSNDHHHSSNLNTDRTETTTSITNIDGDLTHVVCLCNEKNISCIILLGFLHCMVRVRVRARVRVRVRVHGGGNICCRHSCEKQK
jgi:hypothetical protein